MPGIRLDRNHVAGFVVCFLRCADFKLGAPGKHDINLLGLVLMSWILNIRPVDTDPGADSVADERALLADNFGKSVAFEHCIRYHAVFFTIALLPAQAVFMLFECFQQCACLLVASGDCTAEEIGRGQVGLVNRDPVIAPVTHRFPEPVHSRMRMRQRELAYAVKQFQVFKLYAHIHACVLSSRVRQTAIITQAAPILIARTARLSLNARLARSAR